MAIKIITCLVRDVNWVLCTVELFNICNHRPLNEPPHLIPNPPRNTLCMSQRCYIVAKEYYLSRATTKTVAEGGEGGGAVAAAQSQPPFSSSSCAPPITRIWPYVRYEMTTTTTTARTTTMRTTTWIICTSSTGALWVRCDSTRSRAAAAAAARPQMKTLTRSANYFGRLSAGRFLCATSKKSLHDLTLETNQFTSLAHTWAMYVDTHTHTQMYIPDTSKHPH